MFLLSTSHDFDFFSYSSNKTNQLEKISEKYRSIMAVNPALCNSVIVNSLDYRFICDNEIITRIKALKQYFLIFILYYFHILWFIFLVKILCIVKDKWKYESFKIQNIDCSPIFHVVDLLDIIWDYFFLDFVFEYIVCHDTIFLWEVSTP